MMTEKETKVFSAWNDIRYGASKEEALNFRKITEKEYDENIKAVLEKRKKLIYQCRYYNGEKYNPYENDEFHVDSFQYFWVVEEMYVTEGGNIPDNGEYDAYVEKDYSGIPRGILLYMFHRWGKSVIGIKENINSFYELLEEYIDIPSDHIPKDKIPNVKRNIEE